jgi:hypothetical protein
MSALGQKQTPEAFRQCPLYPQKQTLIEGVEMSALCQKRTLDVAIKIDLFDHLVGGR